MPRPSCGAITYQAFCAALGTPQPAWESLPFQVRYAWGAAARAAMEEGQRIPQGMATGTRYDRCTVVRLEKVQGLTQRRSMVVCRCDCGTEFRTTPGNLREHITRSCGCLRVEVNRARRKVA